MIENYGQSRFVGGVERAKSSWISSYYPEKARDMSCTRVIPQGQGNANIKDQKQVPQWIVLKPIEK